MIRVGLVDDHPVVIRGLVAALANVPDIEVRAEAGSVAEARELLDRDDLDVILLDIRLPDGSGLEMLARHGARPRPAVIILSSSNQTQHVAAAVRFGAQGFLVKTARLDDLIASIRLVVAGGSAFTPEQLHVGPRFVSLTGRERELVRLVIAGRSNDEIAAAFQTKRKTVETQLSHLYERFGVVTRTELAILAEREGWLDP